MRRWIGGLALVMAVGGTACDDGLRSNVIVEDIDGSAIDPPDPHAPEPEPEVEPDPHHGDDEHPDGGLGADGSVPPDDGASVGGDADVDAAAPATADAGGEDPYEADAGGSGEADAERPSLPGDPEQDPDGPVPDGQLLPMPGCGSLDPGLAASIGPGAWYTYLHGSPAFRFDEPALAGCHPERLWAGVPGGFRQDITFAYRGTRLLEWRWLLGTPDGGSTVPATVSYDGTGRVEQAIYRCPWGAGEERHAFAYDRQSRLVQHELDRPARCRGDGEPEQHVVTTWRYADPADVLPVSRTVEQARRADDGVDVNPGAAARATVDIEYTRDLFDRLVELREYGADGRISEWRTLTWVGDRVVMQIVRRRPVAAGNREPGLVQSIITYDYDRAGRLVERRDDGDGTLLRIDYGADGELEGVEASNSEALRSMGYPAISVFDRIALSADPREDAERRR